MRAHIFSLRFYILIGLLYFILSQFFNIANGQGKLLQGQNMPLVFPPLLKQQDRVAIVAPAWWAIDKDMTLKQTKEILQSWGLEVVIGKSIGPRCGQFAGNDNLRLNDLQAMLDDPTIKAIFAYRGGHGTTRIIDKLEFTKFLQYPKWLIGFSDLTTMHLKLHQLGVVSIHGEMPRHFPDSLYQSSINSLKLALFKGTTKLTAKPNIHNRVGNVSAPVVGGNLMMICVNIGTEIDLDTKGKILVLEDVGEQLYAIDRMLVQLKRTGKLAHLAGLIVGSMVGMQDKKHMAFGKSVQAIIKEHVAKYQFPVAFNFPIGHKAPNIAFIHGAIGTLSVTEESVALSFGT
ncbi:MAG: S66 peptidase family protein [Candidatus Amoebophilus sp.]